MPHGCIEILWKHSKVSKLRRNSNREKFHLGPASSWSVSKFSVFAVDLGALVVSLARVG